jgi:hypothetical protein
MSRYNFGILVSTVADPPDKSRALNDATNFQVGNDPRMTRAQFEFVVEGWSESQAE